jgi:probable H4MPT-linked C1 transfer pathway protein
MCGELVYTGSLRTNVAATVQSIPLRGGVAGVASELFALSADVHLILGHITEKQYTCETADGKRKTMPQAFARLARVVCADTEMLTAEEIVGMANYIYGRQIIQVAEGLNKVYSHVKKHTSNDVRVVVTGLGKDFIVRKAAEKIAVEPIIDLATLVPTDVSLATPAFAVALMMAKQLEGDKVSWRQ